MKTDYKHKIAVRSVTSGQQKPSFMRLLFFIFIALMVSIVWYQFTSSASNTTDQKISLETEDANVEAISENLKLVALAPLTSLEEITESSLPAIEDISEIHISDQELSSFDPKTNGSLDFQNAAGKTIFYPFTIEPGKNLSFYLNQQGLSAKTIHHLLDVQHKKFLVKVFPGQRCNIALNQDKSVRKLSLHLSATQAISVEAQEDGTFKSQFIEYPTEARTIMSGATIEDSLYIAGKKASLTDNMIMELAHIFAYDIDFALDIRPNDHFKVVFEEYYFKGEKIDNGPILAAEFVNQGKKFTAIRFKDQGGKFSYFTPDGRSLKKAFIRTPVEYTRISSHFNLKRRHPVLHHIRAHKGVDYAAPIGTPVKAAGNGKVDFIGRKGGYGNVVILQHGKKYSTLYAHLHKFHSQLKKDMKIKQGEIIGYVGKSGLATGPHLHYEFRINNQHHNPLTVQLPQAAPLPNGAKTAFLAKAKEYLHLITLQENIMLAKAQEQKNVAKEN